MNTPALQKGFLKRLAVMAVLGMALSRCATAQSTGWETLSPLRPCLPRDEAAMTVLNGKLYLLGGRGIKPVECFDPQANTWQAMAPPPMELHHFQAVTFGGRIVVACAFTDNYPLEQPVPNVWFFDPAKDMWEKGPEIPADRRRGGGGAVVSDGKIYFICGITHGHWNGFVPWCDVWDPGTNQWTRLPDAPHARDHFQAACISGKIVAAGGRTTYGQTNHVFDLLVPEIDIFDLASGKWETSHPKIPTPRAGCSSEVVDDRVLIIGGESMAHTAAHNEVEALSMRTLTWQTLPPLNQGRHGTGSAILDGAIYTASGCAERGGKPLLNSTERLKLSAIPPENAH
jgi:N-acetylneuraminic acid mutarotase